MKRTTIISIGRARHISWLLVFLFLAIFSQPTMAQARWSLGIRPGVNFPTRDLGEVSLNTGFGFEGTIAYRFMPHLAAYTGWGWNKFAGKGSSSAFDYEETGYMLGLQFVHPIGNSKIQYMLRGGGIYNHIETENADGEITNDTGHGLGWEAEAGVAIPLGNRFSLMPGVRYRALSRDMPSSERSVPADLQYISVGAAFTWSFGK